MIETLHFIRPWWLLALVPLAGLLWRIKSVMTGQSQWSKVCDAHLLPHLLVTEDQAGRGLSWWLLAVGSLLAVLILAGPSWSKQTIPVYQAKNARVIVFNLSPSMYAEDLKPSRLVRARFKALDVLKHIHEGQTGMVVFSGEPFVVSPLTQDANTIASMIPVLNPNIMPLGGDKVGLALREAGKLFQQAGVSKGHILLVTDNGGGPAALKAARKLHSRGFITDVLGIGTTQGAPIPLTNGGFKLNASGNIEIPKLNPQALQALAKAGGGRYRGFTNTNSDVNQLLAAMKVNRFEMKAEKTKHQSSLWKDDGHWFVLLLIPLALFAFR